MKRFLFAFLVAFIVSTPFTAGGKDTGHLAVQDVVQVEAFSVEVQRECEIGELVRMKVKGDVDGITWKIEPMTDDFEIIDDGRRAFFSARTGGDFVIIVAAAKGGKPFLFYDSLTVKGEPKIVTGLRGRVGRWLVPVQTPKKAGTLKAMAGVFRKLAGQPTTVDKMLEATALANSAVIGDEITAWVPFLDKLGNELDDLVENKKLETIEQYKATWLEVADALEYNAKG